MREEDDDKRKDRIRVKPASERDGRTEAKPAQFDTVLVRVSDSIAPPGSTQEALDLKGALHMFSVK